MNEQLERPQQVKWRGSTYIFESIDNGEVTWFNPYSGFRGQCSDYYWHRGEPYSEEI